MALDSIGKESREDSTRQVAVTSSEEQNPLDKSDARTGTEVEPNMQYSGVPTVSASGQFPYCTYSVPYYAANTAGTSSAMSHPFAYAYPPQMNYNPMMNSAYMYPPTSFTYPAAGMMYGVPSLYRSIPEASKTGANDSKGSRPEVSKNWTRGKGNQANKERGQEVRKKIPVLSKRHLPPLDTEENVIKWIEERKKRYPTLARIVDKAKQETENKEREQKQRGPNEDAEGDIASERNKDEARPRSRRSCKYFQAGRCRNGKRCNFLHERGDKATNKMDGLSALLLEAERNAERDSRLLEILAFLKARSFKFHYQPNSIVE